MTNEFFKKADLVPLKKMIAKKEIAVRILCPSERPVNLPAIDEVEIAKAYAEEAKILKPLNLAQALVAGAAAGLLLCTVTSMIGIKLSGSDMAAMVGTPALLGLIAGYLLS
jgi:hypothetical protein